MADLAFKNLCQRLRRRGLTLGEIVNITKRSKTSVYFHTRKISLSKIVLLKIETIRREKIITFNHTQKGKSKFGRDFHRFEEWTPQLVNLLGHLMFDGEIRNRKCEYSNRSSALINNLQNLMGLIYDFEPRIYFRPKTGVYKVGYFNVALADYLQNKALELLERISTLPREMQREFLRAFFDDEGSMNFKKKQVHGYQHSSEILELVQRLLKNFRIESKIDYTYQEIIISRKENLKKFKQEINFSKGLAINPKRSNSIWRRPIEKREILNLALKSYQA